MIHKTSAGILIFCIKDKGPLFLLLKYTNYWGFVKGLIEKGEREIDAAMREAKEEANISNIRIINGFRHIIKYFFRFEGDTISKEVIFLLGEVDKEQAKNVKISHEHEDFKWLEFNEAIKIVKHKNEKELLTKSNEFLKEYLKQKTLL